MTSVAINRFIGYGILLFSIGFFVGIQWAKYVQLLMPFGSMMSFIGIFFFFKKTDLASLFSKNPNEDLLTYFWNVVVLKLWVFIFLLWMIVMDLTLLFSGFL